MSFHGLIQDKRKITFLQEKTTITGIPVLLSIQ